MFSANRNYGLWAFVVEAKEAKIIDVNCPLVEKRRKRVQDMK